MKQEHGKVLVLAAVMVCLTMVRWGLESVADGGLRGIGLQVGFSYEAARAMLRWGM